MSLLAALGWLFVGATAASFIALCAAVAHDVPRVLGTVAFIVTLAALAALAAAIPR